VFDAAAGDDGRDTAVADQAPVLVVVVATVGVDPPGPAARLADDAPDRWDGIDERDQLGDLIAMPAGERDGQRNPVRVGEQVMPGTGFAPVDRTRSCLAPLEGAQVGGVNQGGGQVQQPGGAQFGEQPLVQLLPDAGASCHSVNRPPAGRTGGSEQGGGQPVPPDPGTHRVEHAAGEIGTKGTHEVLGAIYANAEFGAKCVVRDRSLVSRPALSSWLTSKSESPGYCLAAARYDPCSSKTRANPQSSYTRKGPRVQARGPFVSQPRN
jgi:hypothetical protein